jgi:hypothetical protein
MNCPFNIIRNECNLNKIRKGSLRNAMDIDMRKQLKIGLIGRAQSSE